MTAGVTNLLGAAIARALDEGFDKIGVRHGGALLACGYEGEPGYRAFFIVDLELLGAPSASVAVAAFTALIETIGKDITDVRFPLELLARAYLYGHAEATGTEELKAELLRRMRAEGRTAIDVAGVGAVTYVPPGKRELVDGDALEQLFDQLSAELGRDLKPPKKSSSVGAGLRVTPAPARESGR